MFGLLASQLLLVVSHDAAAHGQLRQLERYADRAQLVVSLGDGNALSDSALEAIERWPALVAVELLPPLLARDADALRKLRRLEVRLPPALAALSPGSDAGTAPARDAAAAPSRDAKARSAPEPASSTALSLRDARREVPSLELLGPALVRVERAPTSTLAPGPCPGSEERVLPDGSSELRLEGDITRCELDALRARLELHTEPIGDLPAGMQLAPPEAPAPAAKKKKKP